MCDYSLHHVASRPAKVGERIVSSEFPGTITRGFAPVDNANMAVCLLPGTEIAFDRDVETDSSSNSRVGKRTARFRQINTDQETAHHDALEFPSGEIVLVTRLRPGQRATVLQLPAKPAGVAAQMREHNVVENEGWRAPAVHEPEVVR